MKKTFSMMVLLVLMPLSAFSATIDVPGDLPTIQAGIDNAVDGDIVMLADGTYTGTGNFNIHLNGESITVKSSGGAENCIIDCQQNGRGFLVYNGETVTFEGLTIKNGDAGDDNGGGIYVNESSINVANCVFSGNSAYNGGAGFSPDSSFANCTFSFNNASSLGGAVYSFDSSFTNCTFTSNSASQGGAIGSTNSAFSNCTFGSNDATYGGAASSSGSSFTDCIFTSNNASSAGGAVSAWRATNSFTNCTFTSNIASNGGAVSSGHLMFSPFSSFVNCSFTSNSVSGSGGAVSSADSSFSNCIFISNSAFDGGAVVE